MGRRYLISFHVLCAAVSMWLVGPQNVISADRQVTAEFGEKNLPDDAQQLLSWGRAQIAQLFQAGERKRLNEFKEELAAKAAKKGRLQEVQKQLIKELQHALVSRNEREKALLEQNKNQSQSMIATAFVISALAAAVTGFLWYRHTTRSHSSAAKKPETTELPDTLDLSYGETYDFLFPDESAETAEQKDEDDEDRLVAAHASKHRTR